MYRTIERIGTVLLVVVLAGLVLGQVLGQPVFLAYVESESMEPTIETGDGFIAIPTELTGPPQEGDVVSFEAQEIEGGGITTHRIVGETPQGYITEGDGNPFTDQDGGEPYVTEDRIVAKALQIGDDPVTIPYVGVAAETTQGVFLSIAGPLAAAFGVELSATAEGIGLAVFAVGLSLFVLSVLAERTTGPRRDMSRSVAPDDALDGRKVAVAVLVVVLIPANAAMVVPSGPTDIVLDGNEVADASDVSPGDPVDAEFNARNNALITMVVTLEPVDEDVTMDRRTVALPPGERGTATASVPAPSPGTDRTVTITEHRYIQLLPQPVLVGLHDRHPLLAIGALNLLIGVSVLGFVGGLIGFDRVRFRDTSRDVPVSVVVRRWLR